MSDTTGGQIIAKMLKAEGVETFFGIVDGTYIQLFAHCVEEGLKMVTPRHEAVAAHMAGAYARLTGKLGVCIASNGPGVANMLAGVAVENVEGNRVLLITSSRRTGITYPDRGGAYQCFDHVGVIKNMAKWSATCAYAERIPELVRQAFKRYRVDVVVHLAAVVTPGKRSDRQLEYRVDVLGTQNVLQACIESEVKKIIYTSSGAAYGYYADNAPLLDETDPIRGNQEFAYSYHKRLVEEMLARCREEHPGLEQLIFRPGTILGAHTRNQITNLFDQPRITGLKGADSPFVIIWDQDVVGAILKGIFQGGHGIFNMAGDGAITLREMARLLGKPYIALPIWLVTAGLWVGKRLGLTQYGPEQVRFLRYRPVLSNRRLKEEFEYVPKKTTQEAFEFYLESRRHAY